MEKTINKPILFSTEMVQAILEGRKTQTRRITVDWDQHKPKFIISGQGMYAQAYPEPSKYMAHFRYPEESTDSVGLVAPIQPGDLLWVRETFDKVTWEYLYKADDNSKNEFISTVKWKPSIHMPKAAARIFLEVVNVRCERLHDIKEEDAIAEGIHFDVMFKKFNCYLCDNQGHIGGEMMCEDGFYKTALNSFSSLWQSINGKRHTWQSNPWVWVYEFKKIEKPTIWPQ